MKTVTVTEFCNKASEFFSDVENGEVLIVIRDGRPIAEVFPVSSSDRLPIWNQPALRLSSGGAGLSAAVRKEREDETVL